MKKYYLFINGETLGPFFLSDLAEHGATPRTYVWYPGLKDWTVIADIPEIDAALSQQLEPQPPAFSESGFYNGASCGDSRQIPPANELYPRPNNYLAESILALLFCFPLAIVAIIKAMKVNKLYERGEYNQAYIASSEARNWFVAAIAVGVLYLFILMVL